MRIATAPLHSVDREVEAELPQYEQAAPTTVQAPRTTLRFDADPTRPATITTEAKTRSEQSRRGHLERELDRVQTALYAEQTGFDQQLTWLLLSQGLLLNAFVLLLMFSWSAPLPGRRLVLAGLALAALAGAVFILLALRGTRDGLRALTKARKEIESRLEKDHGRRPSCAARSGLSRGLGLAAAKFLPPTCIAGWLALAFYSLGLPPGATSEAARAAAAAPAAAAARVPARAAPVAPAAAPVPQQPKRSPFNFRP